jgi:hypothetical protein
VIIVKDQLSACALEYFLERGAFEVLAFLNRAPMARSIRDYDACLLLDEFLQEM